MAPSRGQAGACGCARRGRRAQSPDSGQTDSQGSNFLPVMCHLYPWVSAFTSLVFSSLIWKMGIIIEPTSFNGCENELIFFLKSLDSGRHTLLLYKPLIIPLIIS